MSTRAHEYFAELSELSSIPTPGILSGRKIGLADSALRIPIHDVEPERLEARVSKLQAASHRHLYRASNFLHGVVHSLYPAATVIGPVDVDQSQLLPQLFSDIVPPKLITGHLHGFKLEAVTAAELPDSTFYALQAMQAQRPQAELALGSVHLLATAKVHSGRELGQVGKVLPLALDVEHDNSQRLTGIFGTASIVAHVLSDDESEVMTNMRKSRGRAWYAERSNIGRSYKSGLPGHGRRR